MTEISPTVLSAIIRESVSLFVLLVLIVLSYRLVDKFGTDFLDCLEVIAKSIERIADKH